MPDRDMIIEVSCLTDFENLDFDDTDADGNCVVDGTYGLTLTDVPEDASLAQVVDATSLAFHRNVAIACLEDYDIDYRAQRPEDAGHFQDVGTFEWELDPNTDPGPDL